MTITRHDKFECYSEVLEYMHYMPKLSNWVAFFRHVEHLFEHVEHLFGIGFTLILAILIINFNFNYFTCVVVCVGWVLSTLQSI